jgi:hypothetical protein
MRKVYKSVSYLYSFLGCMASQAPHRSQPSDISMWPNFPSKGILLEHNSSFCLLLKEVYLNFGL